MTVYLALGARALRNLMAEDRACDAGALEALMMGADPSSRKDCTRAQSAAASANSHSHTSKVAHPKASKATRFVMSRATLRAILPRQ